MGSNLDNWDDDDDDGLPDVAFTEDELAAGVQHIMRTGDPNATSSGDRRSVPWPVEPLDTSESEYAEDVRSSRRNQSIDVAHSDIDSYLIRSAEIKSLAPHLHDVLSNSASNSFGIVMRPFYPSTWEDELSRLSAAQLRRLRLLVAVHLEDSRKRLHHLYREMRRIPIMKASHYGGALSEQINRVKEGALADIDVRLAGNHGVDGKDSLKKDLCMSLDDLAAAKAELERWNDAFANDRSNNPNKYQAQRRDAGIKVRRIEECLKRQGLVKKSESEILNDKLDQLYPNAKSRTIVLHNGKNYQVRYFPVVTSRSRNTVKEWGHSWVSL